MGCSDTYVTGYTNCRYFRYGQQPQHKVKDEVGEPRTDTSKQIGGPAPGQARSTHG